MATKTFCDRCGAQFYITATLMVKDIYGRECWQLCESCCVKLQEWVENND